jgi:hypothetical protein
MVAGRRRWSKSSWRRPGAATAVAVPAAVAEELRAGVAGRRERLENPLYDLNGVEHVLNDPETDGRVGAKPGSAPLLQKKGTPRRAFPTVRGENPVGNALRGVPTGHPPATLAENPKPLAIIFSRTPGDHTVNRSQRTYSGASRRMDCDCHAYHRFTPTAGGTRPVGGREIGPRIPLHDTFSRFCTGLFPAAIHFATVDRPVGPGGPHTAGLAEDQPERHNEPNEQVAFVRAADTARIGAGWAAWAAQ